MSGATVYTGRLDDRALSNHLEKRDTLLFKGLGSEWQQIERQVERLGFGDRFAVSQIAGHQHSTKVSPLQTSSRG